MARTLVTVIGQLCWQKSPYDSELSYHIDGSDTPSMHKGSQSHAVIVIGSTCVTYSNGWSKLPAWELASVGENLRLPDLSSIIIEEIKLTCFFHSLRPLRRLGFCPCFAAVAQHVEPSNEIPSSTFHILCQTSARLHRVRHLAYWYDPWRDWTDGNWRQKSIPVKVTHETVSKQGCKTWYLLRGKEGPSSHWIGNSPANSVCSAIPQDCIRPPSGWKHQRSGYGSTTVHMSYPTHLDKRGQLRTERHSSLCFPSTLKVAFLWSPWWA